MFPETRWSLITRLRKTAEHHGALEDLCRRYWKPAYHYVRAAWAKRHDEAQDLTQAFFLWLLEGEALRKYAPDRGGFRPFLKVLLRRFVGHEEEALRRLKRGGGVSIVPIEDDGFVASQDADPEALFDRAWVAALVDGAITRVRDRLAGDEKTLDFALYEAHDLAADGDKATFADLGDAHGLTARQVKHRITAVREMVRSEIRAELRETTTDDRALEEEWRALFGS